MQNMEKYFGFKVHVNDDLDPEDEAILRRRASEIVNLEAIDLKEYNVYLHQLVIESRDSHFGVTGGISKRIMNISIDFHINEKQRKNRDIKFMNHIIPTGVPEEVKPYFNPEWIGYKIGVGYFERNAWFQNAIIAFVRKEMRHSHKKIKAVVSVSATPEFASILHSRNLADTSTHLDLRFERNVQLRLHLGAGESAMAVEGKNVNVFNNYGNVGAFGSNPNASQFTFDHRLISDLNSLVKAANVENEHDKSRSISEAIDLLKEKKNVKAFDMLKKAGKWGVSTSEKLGLTAAAEAIKAAISA